MRLCLEQGCPHLVPAGRCQVHQRSKWPRGKVSPAYRGDWPKIRAQVLKEEPTCALRLPGCTVVSTDCDHIVSRSRGGTNVRSNLRGVCHSCHKKVTAHMKKRSA